MTKIIPSALLRQQLQPAFIIPKLFHLRLHRTTLLSTTNLLILRRHASKPLSHKRPQRSPSRPSRQQQTTNPPSQSTASSNLRTAVRSLRFYHVIASIFVFTVSAYVALLFTPLLFTDPAPSEPEAQDNTLTTKYDDVNTAEGYDKLVDDTEAWTGIIPQRKKLVEMARGSVLEMCVGTGRNLGFYRFGKGRKRDGGGGGNEDEDGQRDFGSKQEGLVQKQEEADSNDTASDYGVVTSLTCIDRSEAMLTIAQRKWSELYTLPPSSSTSFFPFSFFSASSSKSQQPPKQPIQPIFLTQTPSEPKFYTTTLQSFGLCSLPSPTLHLLDLASRTDPHDGQILLLEHGRSSFSAFPPPAAPKKTSSSSLSSSSYSSAKNPTTTTKSVNPTNKPSSRSGYTEPTSREDGWLVSIINYILDRSAQRHAERHGCWFNRDIGQILAECEQAGILVVEGFGRAWRHAGTVYLIKCRVGPALGGKPRGIAEGVEKW